nr:MAG TPA: hypothetical protein [Caudoviricetes sp.]
MSSASTSQTKIHYFSKFFNLPIDFTPVKAYYIDNKRKHHGQIRRKRK